MKYIIKHIVEYIEKTFLFDFDSRVYHKKITIKQCAELICLNPKYATRMGRNRPITAHNDFLLA